jgi:DNA-binding MarR family transcriptional regulator
MSRDSRDPTREPAIDEPDRETRARPDRQGDRGRPWSPSDHLTLPRSPDRRAVSRDRERYVIRDSETELLATVGAFRVVPERELLRDRGDGPSSGDTDARSRADIRSLSDQELIERRTIVINHSLERVVVLTRAGKELLEGHRERSHPAQEYYGGLDKPRDLAHDAQLYRMFQTEREHLESAGARVVRVVLDYELKRDYHSFVHELQQTGGSANDARRTFAEAHDLPFVRGHIKLPDVRIEYESVDGDRVHRDLELATEHYSRSRVSGKQSAGFRVYRAAGARLSGGGKTGGSALDPHHLEWLR